MNTSAFASATVRKQEAARDESASLSKAVIRGLVSLADQGWWPGGMAPYGYDLGYYDQTGTLYQVVRNTDDGQKLILDSAGNPVRTVRRGQKVKGSDREHVRLLPSTPERTEVIRRIFAWYTGGAGLGFKSIADRLNQEGIISPKGKGWAMSTIRVIIMNPAYIGRVTWNRRRMGKFHRISDRREVERDGWANAASNGTIPKIGSSSKTPTMPSSTTPPSTAPRPSRPGAATTARPPASS